MLKEVAMYSADVALLVALILMCAWNQLSATCNGSLCQLLQLSACESIEDDEIEIRAKRVAYRLKNSGRTWLSEVALFIFCFNKE